MATITNDSEFRAALDGMETARQREAGALFVEHVLDLTSDPRVKQALPMTARVIVDPVTRIEGHLRIEAKMNGGVIEQAYSSGTSVRGLETIVLGRDPRDAWAFVQRICGVCTLVHGIAGVRAVEDALNWEIPPNAELIRNLMIGAQYVHDHVMHFYHLHALDWVDVVSALQADPKATSELAQSISAHGPSPRPGYFADVQKKLKGFVESGQLGIFANAYWGHPGYKLPPEANLMATAHYLEALAWQRDVAKLHAIFGGKNPHPNFCVGGVPCAQMDLRQADSAINGKKLSAWSGCSNDHGADARVRRPGLRARHHGHRELLQGLVPRGEGLGNFMTYGDFPPAGPWRPVELFDPARRHPEPRPEQHPAGGSARGRRGQEFIGHSWYDYKAARTRGLHPWEGETRLDYDKRGGRPLTSSSTSPTAIPGSSHRAGTGKAMEVGPLARVLLLYATRAKATRPSRTGGLDAGHARLAGAALFSTLGRTAARTLETKIIADAMQDWFDSLMANIKAGDTKTFNAEALGAVELAQAAQGRRFHGGPARRRSRTGSSSRTAHRQLPGRGAEHLERRPARPAEPARRLRGGAAGQPRTARPEAAHRDPAHHPQLRPLHRLRGAPDGQGPCRAAPRGAAVVCRVSPSCLS
jgi:hydrogenase large subunit